jgi:PAS domain S-box-containing protein
MIGEGLKKLYGASEERWSKLAENSSAGIALIAPEGRFIAANLALQKMLGYTEEELKGLTALDITPEEDGAATEARIAEAYEGTRRDYRFEKRYLRKDGTLVWVDVSSVFVPASGSNPAFFSAVIVDRTNYKRAEEALRQAQTELAYVSRLTTMGELTASIAHEVSQPLAGIVTNANATLRWMAGNSPNLTEAREAIRRIIRDGKRASDVISRMRALFKKAPVTKERLDINEVVEEVLILTQIELQWNRVSPHVELANDLPLILGDRIELQQVMLNLLINAIEAMRGVREGPRELQISSEKVAQIPGESKVDSLADRALAQAQGTHILIAFRDSGPGLDPKDLGRLFEAFYTTKPQGMGMGLAISRSIIEAHGGRLWAKANAPRGAVFQFTVPIREETVL